MQYITDAANLEQGLVHLTSADIDTLFNNSLAARAAHCPLRCALRARSGAHLTGGATDAPCNTLLLAALLPSLALPA